MDFNTAIVINTRHSGLAECTRTHGKSFDQIRRHESTKTHCQIEVTKFGNPAALLVERREAAAVCDVIGSRAATQAHTAMKHKKTQIN